MGVMGDLLGGLYERWVNRGDTLCIQQPNGRYLRRYGEVTPLDLADHLVGVHTLALDAVGADGLTRWGMCDSDAPDGLATLMAVWDQLAMLGLAALLESSRRGGHLWVLFSTPQPAVGVRRVLHAALARVGVAMEVYPNTNQPAAGGVAQPVRLPLGVHQVTGLRYPFLDRAGRAAYDEASDLAGPFWFVAQPRNTTAHLQGALIGLADPPAVLHAGRDVVPLAVPQSERGDVGATYGAVAWAKRQSFAWLIAQTRPSVALRRAGRGYLGWCPFHDDDAPQEDGTPGQPSLYVYCDAVHGWRWKCFSTNCGANPPPVKDAFDWLVWCRAGSVPAALADADDLAERTAHDEG